MKPGLRRPGRDVEDIGRLGQRQTDEEVQDKHGTLLDRQSAERSTDLIAIRDRESEIRRRGGFEVGHHVQLDHGPSLRLTRRLVAGANVQAVKPAIPRVRFPESANVLPGEHERLLDRVLGAVLVAEDELRGAVQPGRRGPYQDGKGFVIARLRSFDELTLHVATAAARPL